MHFTHFFISLFGTIRIHIGFALFFVSVFSAYGQINDTSNTLTFEKFEKEDLIRFKPQTEQKVYSAGRILEDVSEFPQDIHIISREDIVEEGYSTLVDLLKNIPGFRTSQPCRRTKGKRQITSEKF